MANLIRGLSENGGVVFCGVDSTQIVRKAEKLHTTSATCSAALGRLLTGAALMGSMLKDDRDQITLRVSGGGPAGVVIACTDGTGNVKGCIDHPLVELPAKPNGHLDVGGAVGKDGVLTVIRDNRLQKEPTVGQVPLVSGEIAEDLTAYYAYSEQVPTVMALGVLVDKDLSILCAGGFMVQLLPGATDAEIDQLEKNIAAMPSVTTLLHEGKTPEDMMQLALAGFAPNVLDERDVHYQCDCSAERTKEMLFSLGRKELVKMRDEDPNCEVVCHFCHSKYQYDLNDLIAEVTADMELKPADQRLRVNIDFPQQVEIVGSPSLLTSIFRNLADNAAAYSGGRDIFIRLLSDTPEECTVSFADNGIGIGEEHLPHIFERFYRVDKGRSRAAGGTGLGLSIVKNAILLHHGKISVENRPTGGLLFTITLPLAY